MFDRRYKKVHIVHVPIGYHSDHAARFAMNDKSLKRILHLNLNVHLSKVQIAQSLNLGDYQQKIRFCEGLYRRLKENDDQVNNYSMNDEALFHLSGFVNKQNFSCWPDTNPRLLHETPLYSQKITVNCVI